MEKAARPGAGAGRERFTADAVALACTFLGLSPVGLDDVPAVHPDKPQSHVAPEAARRRHRPARPRRPRPHRR